jgi:hypothetical protein
MDRIPRISSVEVAGSLELLVMFDDGSKRVYDCRPLLHREGFDLLRTEAFFRAVRVDAGGYGVSWNDDIDLSEHELWTNGKPVREEDPAGV